IEHTGGMRRVGVLAPDVGGQRREAHCRMDATVGVEHRLAQPHEAKATAALPAHRLRDPTLFAFHDLLQAGQTMRARVLAHLDADPAPAHLVRHRGGGAGAEEAVEDEVAWVGGDLQDTLDQPLRLWCREWNISWKQRHNFRFCLTIRADFIMWPECYRNQTRLNFRRSEEHTSELQS